MNPRYPIYIISKGRWESRLTSKEFDRLGVPYLIVVEPQEYNQYAAVIDPNKILKTPEPFSLRQQGSIPVRNFVWEHSVSTGAERHWVVDDNIHAFWRLNNNLRIRVASGTVIRCMEDFTDRYENVWLSGPNYYMFARDWTGWPAYYLNTRVYSCILIRNNIPIRWRGRYNEDTDLSLRALKAGACTLLFDAFLAQKATTLTMKGGNMETLYKGDGRLKMAQSLVEQHPDVVTITTKWGRPQHQVYYRAFRRNKLIRKPGWNFAGINNYGMNLVEIPTGQKVTTLKTQQETTDNPTKPFDMDNYWKDSGFAGQPGSWDTTNL